jgi:DNA-binding NtrC family response regulator
MTIATILCVDDEAEVLAALQRVFLDTDYRVIVAASGEEALGILAEIEVEVIISDYKMPQMNGGELLSRAHRRDPNVIGIVLSGYIEADTVLDLIEADVIYTFVAKPWHDDELRLTVKRAIDYRRMRKKLARLEATLASTA